MFLITVFGFLIANSPSYVLIRDFKEKVEEEIGRIEKRLEKIENKLE
jgi:predicted DNA-binding transcriptional regulator